MPPICPLDMSSFRSKDALAKAQKMAAIQAKIAAQMQFLGNPAVSMPGMPSMTTGAVPGIPVGVGVPSLPKKETFMPAPLILDDKGRHIDATGKEVNLKPTTVNVLKANLRESSEIAMVEPKKPEVDVASIIDPRMSLGTSVRYKRPTFQFVEDSRYIKRADRFRTKMAVAEFNTQLKKMCDACSLAQQ